MKNYKCEVKTGVIFRRVCNETKAYSCSSCQKNICFNHAHNKDTSGLELCPDCYYAKNPLEPNSVTRPSSRGKSARTGRIYYDDFYYSRDYDSNYDRFSDEDYAVFDQINKDGQMELDDSYDS